MTPQKNNIIPLTKKQISDQARGVMVRERNVVTYYTAPARCGYCDKIIEIREGECLAHAKRRKFCNQSCAASFNAPMRKKSGTAIVHPRNLRGKIFGKLEVISEGIIRNDKGSAFHMCRCECGEEKLIYRSSLLSGNTSSCGCWKRELVAERSINGVIPLEVQGPRYVLARYKANAKGRGYEFSLTLEEFTKIIEGTCVYCGMPHSMKYKRKRTEYLYNGADRVDSGQGYVTGNVVSCCMTCNRAKNCLSLEIFQAWIDRIADFRASKYLSLWA